MFALSSDETSDKEILANMHADSPHVPKVEKLGHTRDKTVYAMPHYRAPLRKADSPEGWKDYVALKKCHDDAFNAKRAEGKLSPYDLGYPVSTATVDCARAVGVRPQVVEALDQLVAEAANYGATHGLEFAPRNLATDEVGNLVLLDVLFDLEAMQRQRAAKAVRGW